jgi:hypothetical protein
VKFKIDESRMLYGLGAFLGVIAILYFGQELILDLSPAVKSFILFSATAAFISGAEYSDQPTLRSVLYLFSAFSYLSFLAYIFLMFGFSSVQIFMILASSSMAFMLLGYVRSEELYYLTDRKAEKFIAAVVALIAIAVVFDVAGAQPEYSLELKDSVEVVENQQVVFGELEVRNDFALSRNIDVPTYGGCLSASDNRVRGVYVSPEATDMIEGDSTLSFNLTDSFRSRPDENTGLSGSYIVQRGECPDNPETGIIYIDESGDGEVLRSD